MANGELPNLIDCGVAVDPPIEKFPTLKCHQLVDTNAVVSFEQREPKKIAACEPGVVQQDS